MTTLGSVGGRTSRASHGEVDRGDDLGGRRLSGPILYSISFSIVEASTIPHRGLLVHRDGL